MSAEAKNLEAIQKAIVQHNGNCPRGPVAEIRLNPFEVDRLGWDEFRGIPIVGDDQIGTGRFRLVCRGDVDDAPAVEAAAEEREPLTVGAPAGPRETEPTA